MRDRNAMAVCVFGFFAVSVAPSALHLAPLPPSLAAVPTFGHISAWILLAGCLGSLAGILRPDHDKALLTEQFFVAIAGAGFLCYAVANFYASWLTRHHNPHWYANSAYVVGLCLGIAAFTGWRFAQIQRYVTARRLLKRQHEEEATPGREP